MQQQARAHLIDLHAYLDRLGIQTPVTPDLQTLHAIIAAHAAAIPFENLDPFLGMTPSLDIASVQRKLVRDGRGGYCFEQNRLLSDALQAIGFNVTDLAARVLWGQPEDAITARSHMLLRVEIAGKSWLADAGFGGNTPTAPLELVPDVEQATPHEPYRLIRRNDSDWRLQLFAADAWQTLYRFDLQPQFPADYRISNYWTSTNPDSHFVTGLTAARAPAGRRLALRNRQFTEHAIGGGTKKRTLTTAAEIHVVLQNEFLIRLPDGPELGEMLDRIPE
jgi:N-hydroxyarylamine O-acetyltransferase